MKPDDACNKQGLHLPHPAKLPHMTPEYRLGPGICNAMPKMFVASSKDAMSSTTSAGETSASARPERQHLDCALGLQCLRRLRIQSRFQAQEPPVLKVARGFCLSRLSALSVLGM